MTVAWMVQGLLLIVAILSAIQYARGGLRANAGPILFHLASACLVGGGMVAHWDSARALFLQAALIGAPYVISLGYRLGMDRALGDGDYSRALTMARSRAMLLPFASHARDARTLERLVDTLRDYGLDAEKLEAWRERASSDPDAEAVWPLLLVAALRRWARGHDWETIRRHESDVRALPRGGVRALGFCLLARAHAEARDLDGALESLRFLEAEPEWHRVRRHARSAWLATLATGGRQQAVGVLLERHFSRLDPLTSRAWRVRTAVAAGDRARACAELDALLALEGLEDSVRAALEAQREGLPDEAPERGVEVEKALDRLEGQVVLESGLVPALDAGLLRLPGLVSLGVVLVAVQVSGWTILSSDELLNGFAVFGALGRVEPWRFVGGVVLSEGTVHLFLNLATAGVVGAAVAGTFGRLGLWTVFLVSGIASGVVSGLVYPDRLIVTSSAAILGLVGACLACAVRVRMYLPRSWWTVLGWRVAVVSAGLGVATVSVPHLDPVGAAVGLVTGMVLGAVLPLERFDLAVPSRIRRKVSVDAVGGRPG